MTPRSTEPTLGEDTAGARAPAAKSRLRPKRPSQRRRETVAAGRPAGPTRPAIEEWPLDFPDKRRRETAAYAMRHYGASARLDPKVIVEHYTATPTAQAAYDIFAVGIEHVSLGLRRTGQQHATDGVAALDGMAAVPLGDLPGERDRAR